MHVLRCQHLFQMINKANLLRGIKLSTGLLFIHLLFSTMRSLFEQVVILHADSKSSDANTTTERFSTIESRHSTVINIKMPGENTCQRFLREKFY